MFEGFGWGNFGLARGDREEETGRKIFFAEDDLVERKLLGFTIW